MDKNKAVIVYFFDALEPIRTDRIIKMLNHLHSSLNDCTFASDFVVLNEEYKRVQDSILSTNRNAAY